MSEAVAETVTKDKKSTQSNPFRTGEEERRTSGPCVIVIFGASGDLTRRKLIPAIYALRRTGHLSAHHPALGFARTDMSDDQFRDDMRSALRDHSRIPNDSDANRVEFLKDLYYHVGDYTDPSTYDGLAKRLKKLSDEHGARGNYLFYLATPPASFEPILKNLKKSGLVEEIEGCFRRVIVEKPIGSDRESARELNSHIHHAFKENQVFRIDHYLGKETVQNVLAFRFGNGIFEPLWNRRYIDHVQITAAESIGVGSRAGYFDKSGITRDMFQSHLLQLLTLIAMEPPVTAQGEAIRDEKVKVLRAIKPYNSSQVIRNAVRAQYIGGIVNGESVVGYREESGVPDNSQTETYLGVRLEIDNWRWSGVPFYIRTGKRLAKRVTQVNIVYKKPPLSFFDETGAETPTPNALGIRIQPEEGIALSFVAKRPGPSFHIDPVRMDFQYRTAFGSASPEAYERLILDAIIGEMTLFAREDEVDLSWGLVDPMTEAFSMQSGAPLYVYQAGSWGPQEASALLKRSGREWYRL